jgi:hypothetical protein
MKGVRDVTFGKSIRDGFAWLREQVGLQPGNKQADA